MVKYSNLWQLQRDKAPPNEGFRSKYNLSSG